MIYTYIIDGVIPYVSLASTKLFNRKNTISAIFMSTVSMSNNSNNFEKASTLLKATIQQGKIEVPVLPETAHQVMTLIQDPESDAAQLASIIQSDRPLSPALRTRGQAAGVGARQRCREEALGILVARKRP